MNILFVLTAHASSEISNQAMLGATNSLQKKFTPSMLIARRSLFHNSLVDIVKEHHKVRHVDIKWVAHGHHIGDSWISHGWHMDGTLTLL